MTLERAYQRLIAGHNKSLFAHCVRGLLTPLSWVYQSVVCLRNLAYDKGLLRQYRVPVPVVSIGNIVAGGTGKTPITLHLVERISQNKKVAILSRGYRSPAEKRKTPTLLCQGEGPLKGPEECGDEPYLLAKHLPHCILLVGKDRVAAAQEAVRLGAELIFLDDGMQHRRLARSLDIVLMDLHCPFGQGACLPRGLLREPLKALKRAGAIVLTHCEPSDKITLTDQLKPYTSAPTFATQFVVDGLENHEGLVNFSLVGAKIGLFCGIAKPSQFLSTLREEGAMIVAQLLLGDHREPTAEQLSELGRRAEQRGASCLICTEKDAVKLSSSHFTLSRLPIFWLRRRVEMDPIEEKNLIHTLYSL